MADLMRGSPESKVRAQLGRFGFGQDRADVTVAKLSGGEKARLLFALMSRDAPHLMILDEPTNHLDIDSREALVAALNAYDGAVVLVSHDPRLIELVVDRLLLVADGCVRPFEGDLAAYRKYITDCARDKNRGGSGEKASGASRKDARRAAAEARLLVAPLRKQVQETEKALEKLQAKQAELDVRLTNSGLNQDSAPKIATLRKEQAELAAAIAKAEATWLKAQEALEDASV